MGPRRRSCTGADVADEQDTGVVSDDPPGWLAAKILPDVVATGCIGSGWDIFPHSTRFAGWEIEDHH